MSVGCDVVILVKVIKNTALSGSVKMSGLKNIARFLRRSGKALGQASPAGRAFLSRNSREAVDRLARSEERTEAKQDGGPRGQWASAARGDPGTWDGRVTGPTSCFDMAPPAAGRRSQ